MSIFGVILVRIFLHSDQNNFEYGHFLRSDNIYWKFFLLQVIVFSQRSKASVSQNFSFSFYSFNNALKLQKWSVFSRKNWKLFINTVLMQLDRRLVPYLYLMLKNEIMLFWNISNIGHCCNWIALNVNFKSKWVFWFAKIYEENLNWRSLGHVRNENKVFPHTILDKKL